MDRFLVSIILLASVIGPMTCASTGDSDTPNPEPTKKPPITTSSTTPAPTTPTTTKPTTTTLPPTSSSSTTSKPTHSTSTTTSVPPTTSPTTPSPHPSTTQAPPSDRKFEAFSFIGGFALAIGLVAIGVLAWKLYISRRDNVYHTL